MMSRNYDVIIAGAGPAGSTAGYILSKSGLSVLIIDKSNFPRNKLCSGLITHKTIKLAERVFGETADALREQNIINFESGHYEFRNKEKLIAERSFSVPFSFIDRHSYDFFLLQKAREKGADVIEGDGVASLDVIQSSVMTRSGQLFKGDFIIGADGVNSKIRRTFPVDLFGRDDWTGNLAAAHEIFISRKSIKKQINHPIIFFDFIDYGYAWIFPNKNRLRIGICGLKKKNPKDILTSFREFLSEMDLNEITNEKILSYVIPYGCYLPSPIFRNIVLTGDAAGFADPFLAEGIYYAQRSSELASHAILETLGTGKSYEQLKDNYLNALQTYILPEFIYAEKIRDTIFTYLNKFRWYPLKIIMSLLGDKSVEAAHGFRSYKWMRKIMYN